MNEIVKKVEEIVDRSIDVDDIKKELTTLKKMLNIGFEQKTKGMDRIIKTFSSNETDKISDFYDQLGNYIKALYIRKDFEQFNQYLSINFGITIQVSEAFPRVQYVLSPKKKAKFLDLYSSYFLEESPRDAVVALDKILNSMYNLILEHKKEEDPIKQEFNDLIVGSTYPSLTVKTLEKIIKKAKKSQEDFNTVASELDSTLTEQYNAIKLIEED